jgi:hypothetical protein
MLPPGLIYVNVFGCNCGPSAADRKLNAIKRGIGPMEERRDVQSTSRFGCNTSVHRFTIILGLLPSATPANDVQVNELLLLRACLYPTEFVFVCLRKWCECVPVRVCMYVWARASVQDLFSARVHQPMIQVLALRWTGYSHLYLPHTAQVRWAPQVCFIHQHLARFWAQFLLRRQF